MEIVDRVVNRSAVRAVLHIMRKSILMYLLWNLTIHQTFVSSTATAVRLNIIIIILGEDPNYGWYATGPMYDVAFQHVGKLYPGLLNNCTSHILYQRNVTDCSAAAANVVAVTGQMFGFVSGNNDTTVIFSPGGSEWYNTKTAVCQLCD